jgi:hypothetical protein
MYGVKMIDHRASELSTAFTEAPTIANKGVISRRVIDKGRDSFIVDMGVTLHWRTPAYTPRIQPDDIVSLSKGG